MKNNKITLLIVDDDEVDLASYRRMIKQSSDMACDCVDASNAKEAMRLLDEEEIDCILLDYLLPDINGLDLLKAIKEKIGERVPVIMLTGHGSEDIAVKAMKEGAVDYLVKNKIEPAILIKTIIHAIKNAQLKMTIQDQKKRLEYCAYYDGLTGLMNRHTFEEMAKQAFANAVRHGDALAVIVVDLDNFITINDTFGQLAGDEILIETGKRLKAVLPQEVLLARWGDDEFAMLIAGPEIEHRSASLAKKILDGIKKPIALSIDTINIGASIGIASYPSNSNDLNTLLKNAYTALLQAKGLGKGIVMHYTNDMALGK